MKSENMRVVMISSVHDYRMARRGSFQSIAEALRGLGYEVIFISIRFSIMSFLKRDPRCHLWHKKNVPEISETGVTSFLWWTLLHPFTLHVKFLNWDVSVLYDWYRKRKNTFIDSEIAAASYIIIESGLGVILCPRIRDLNKHASIIYRASDLLTTIGAPPIMQQILQESDKLIDYYCLPSKKMQRAFLWSQKPRYFVSQLWSNVSLDVTIGSPYKSPLNALSVGPTLFDETFYTIASKQFPQINFHIIGSGYKLGQELPNVFYYDEMPFSCILPFIKYANFGIACYKLAPYAEYLSDTSLKLSQYSSFGKPSVCPYFATGSKAGRFGYTPGDSLSIKHAITAALECVMDESVDLNLSSAADIAQRLINPRRYPDCFLTPVVDDHSAYSEISFSLIVCTVGRFEVLDRLLTSLTKQVYKNFEIIIIDQNDDDRLIPLIDVYKNNFSIIHKKCERGLSKARNAGISIASGNVFCFPDDDCWYGNEVLNDVNNTFKRTELLDILSVKTTDANGTPSVSLFRKDDGPINMRNVWTSGNSNGIFVRAPVFSTVGGFNEELGVGARSPFQSGEETDFLLRAIKLGNVLFYSQKIKVFHDQVEKTDHKANVNRSLSYAKGFGRVLRLNGFGELYLFYRLARTSAKLLISYLLLDFKRAAVSYKWLVGTYLGYRHLDSLDKRL